MDIYFTRHGQTNFNLLNLCNDDPTIDVHLTKEGILQARKAKEDLKEVKFDLVITSELPRTKETALIITEDYQTIFHTDSRINDRKTGFEGKSVSDFFKAIKSDMLNMKIDGGESFQEEKKRVFAFLKELKSCKNKNILVVSHSETMQIINGYSKNLSDNEMLNTRIDNCAIFKITL